MAQANFADDLYRHQSPELRAQGCGQLGFCNVGAWYYERHGGECAPGKWRVGVTASEAREFWPLLSYHAQAVVDDFGTLRMVGEVL